MKHPGQTCENCKFEYKGTCDWVGSNYYPVWIERQIPPTEGIDAGNCDTWQPRGNKRPSSYALLV